MSFVGHLQRIYHIGYKLGSEKLLTGLMSGNIKPHFTLLNILNSKSEIFKVPA